jgi:glycosyltransferase involved in cell wall biosynthesis
MALLSGVEDSRPLIVATNFRELGSTGVHTHFQQVARYVEQFGMRVTVVTPFSWARSLTYPVFAPRLVLAKVYPPASVVWYRRWHEVFLYKALRRELGRLGDCVVYAQGPLEARAALRARTGPNQRVVLAVHFRTSQADEYSEPGRELKRDGRIFLAIRQLERDVIPRVDGIVYVTKWAKDQLLSWLPEAASVPSTVISNFVAPLPFPPAQEPLGDLVTTGRLDDRKNHRFLLEVLRFAVDAGHRLTLDIYGEGPLRGELGLRIASLGLGEQVRLRGVRRDVRQYLPGYKAYVHAAYAETSSLAIIEAMAAGLPILAGRIGPIAELVDDGAEARFWPLDDPAQAADILIGMMKSEQDRSKAASAAFDRFHRDYDASVLGPRIRSFLLDGG